MQLRPYQVPVVPALFNFFRERKPAIVNPLLVFPTGSGKTAIIAAIVQELTGKYKMRVLVVTHQKELIIQNFEMFKKFAPDVDAGIYSASVGFRNTHNKVIFAGVQSIYNKAEQFGNIHAVIVDECHLIPANGNGMYNTLIDSLRKISGNTVPLIGLTATPFRMDSGYLHKGDDSIFTDIAYEIDINELLDAGYLSPLTTKSVSVTVDASDIKSRGGDFIVSQLEKATEEITEAAILDAIPRMASRKSVIVFCVTVSHARHVANLLDDCEVICGETPQKERDELLRRFKSGELRCLASVNVLTTGFDAPNVDCIIMLRKTQSTGLYVQMLGRGLRICEGKVNCLVLDYAGNIFEHGMLDQIKVTEKAEKGTGDAPVKVCPKCESFCHASIHACPDCGYEFPQSELALNREPSEAVLFSRDYEPTRFDVSRCIYNKHTPREDGKKPTMRVDYFDDSGMFPIKITTEYVCIYHPMGSYPYIKAMQWCEKRGLSVEEMKMFVEGVDYGDVEPQDPSVIYVDDREKFPVITKTIFEEYV